MATMDNSAEINFGTAAGGLTVSQYRASFGSNTLAINTGWIALNEERQFVQNDPLKVPAGDLNIEIPRGDFPNTFAKAFLDDFLARRGTTVTVELGHSGSEITDSGYSEQTATFASEL